MDFEDLARAFREGGLDALAQTGSLGWRPSPDSRAELQQITMPAATFAKHGERLFARHPICKLTLEPVNQQSLARLARLPRVVSMPRIA